MNLTDQQLEAMILATAKFLGQLTEDREKRRVAKTAALRRDLAELRASRPRNASLRIQRICEDLAMPDNEQLDTLVSDVSGLEIEIANTRDAETERRRRK